MGRAPSRDRKHTGRQSGEEKGREVRPERSAKSKASTVSGQLMSLESFWRVHSKDCLDLHISKSTGVW